MAGFIDHPRYSQIITKIDAMMQSIDDAQAVFYSVNGYYFQGILAPDTVQDGMTDASVNWAVHPSDQLDSWKDFAPNVFKNNTKIPFQIKIDVYEAPTGFGYTTTLEVWYDGLGPDQFGNDGPHWIYLHHIGPDPAWPEEYYDVPFILIEEPF